MKTCGHKMIPTGTGTGYAINDDGTKLCYACCGTIDRAELILKGTSKGLPLYWAGRKVTNWPGTLSFEHTYSKRGKHNIGGMREDVWFDGPDGYVWHGVVYGDSQILNAKRTRRPAAS